MMNARGLSEEIAFSSASAGDHLLGTQIRQPETLRFCDQVARSQHLRIFGLK
jgi:hypothetical protein